MNQEVEEAKKNKANVDHLRDNVDGIQMPDVSCPRICLMCRLRRVE